MGHRAQALGEYRRVAADHEHPTGVSVEAFLDGGDVEIDDVATLQWAIVRNAMADLMIDRSANRLGVGRIARRCIIEGRGDAVLNIHHVIVTQPVQFGSGHAGPYIRFDVVEDFAGKTSGNAHSFYVFSCLDSYGHLERRYCGIGQFYLLATEFGLKDLGKSGYNSPLVTQRFEFRSNWRGDKCNKIHTPGTERVVSVVDGDNTARRRLNPIRRY